MKQNPDLVGTDPAVHVVYHGAKEGRRIFDPIKIAASISCIPVTKPKNDNSKRPGAVDVYVSSVGNIFMNEIARGVCDAIELCSFTATLKSELNGDYLNPKPKIVVAPHEFFLLNAGREYFNPAFMKNCIAYNTEQLQTQWFSSALPEMLSSAAIVDICNQSASIFRSANMPALHWEPAIKPTTVDLASIEDHPLLKAVPNIHDKVDWYDRPIDLSFFGAQSPRREKAFGRIAPRVAGLNSFIYYKRRSTPLTYGFDKSLTEVAEAIAQKSKIYLNIHRDVMPYFEWHRIARQGIGNDCVVISDHCLEHPVYKPGIHYIQVNARHVGDAIDWILNDHNGQRQAAAIRRANQTMLNNNKFEHSNAETLVNFIADNTDA
ncbi:hypothetical protein [Brucella pituitosa]|uniref:Glycosyltransferase family 1 protein n=1 Tax=Brucella pituitosa TaxID=571256 RepID=A0ABS3K0E2_9HYPH|nr:hypothetical protein [Brucella pituitosa]MBO1040396.1 hypothetical protein [Brucella pituitosa]